MEIFRIALKKYSEELFASGRENRWNFKDEKVLYTASSRSLACLENVVHSSGEALQQDFNLMVIYVPDATYIESINVKELPVGWNQRSRVRTCQSLGSEWLKSKRSLLLKVPSAIVNQEYNYLINWNHADFKNLEVIDKEVFCFDPRIKNI